jgi:hypothetical protein
MNKFTKYLMLAVALTFDIIELILAFLWAGLIVNRVLTIIEYCIFFPWFNSQGVRFMGNTKRITSMVGSFITEMIPVLGALPGLTVGVFLTIRSHEEELKQAGAGGDSSSVVKNNQSSVIRRKKDRQSKRVKITKGV